MMKWLVKYILIVIFIIVLAIAFNYIDYLIASSDLDPWVKFWWLAK